MQEEKRLQKSKEELWGLMLLWSHLQRIYTFHRTLEVLGSSEHEEQIETLSNILDLVLSKTQPFVAMHGLLAEDVQELMTHFTTIKSLTDDYVKGLQNEGLVVTLAVASSEIYGEEHLNKGTICWGDQFNPDVADQYRQRIFTHNHFVSKITNLVQKTLKTETLQEEELKFVINAQQYVIDNADDFATKVQAIELLIKGHE